MYIALHYTKVNGTVYTPGEVITEDIAADKAARLIEKGAIREPEAPFLAPKAQAEEPVDKPDESGDEGGSGAEDAPGEDEAAEDAGDDDGEDYEDEDAEAPEIDVADSISAPDTEPEPQEKKPAQRRRGRKE